MYIDTENILLPHMLRKKRLGEGALELIELAGVLPLGAAPARLGSVLDSMAAFFGSIVGGGIGKIASTLADIIHVPTDLISQGVDLVLLNFASIVSGIPVIGDFIATILVAVDALIKLAISLPELVLRQIATLAAGMKTLTAQQQVSAFTTAMALINKSAPPDIAPTVAKTIKTAPAAYGVDTGGGGVVGWVVGLLAAGAPVAGAAALAA